MSSEWKSFCATTYSLSWVLKLLPLSSDELSGRRQKDDRGTEGRQHRAASVTRAELRVKSSRSREMNEEPREEKKPGSCVMDSVLSYYLALATMVTSRTEFIPSIITHFQFGTGGDHSFMEAESIQCFIAMLTKSPAQSPLLPLLTVSTNRVLAPPLGSAPPPPPSRLLDWSLARRRTRRQLNYGQCSRLS